MRSYRINHPRPWTISRATQSPTSCYNAAGEAMFSRNPFYAFPKCRNADTQSQIDGEDPTCIVLLCKTDDVCKQWVQFSQRRRRGTGGWTGDSSRYWQWTTVRPQECGGMAPYHRYHWNPSEYIDWHCAPEYLRPQEGYVWEYEVRDECRYIAEGDKQHLVKFSHVIRKPVSYPWQDEL